MLYSLPKLTDDKSFENLCCDIMRAEFPLGFTVYGRNGQKQNGIDILPTISRQPYIQCKNHQGDNKRAKDKFIEEIKSDYTDAILYFDDCSHFLVFTTLNRDVYIIDKLRYFSNDDKPIVPYFWEDITSKIIYHPDLLKIYFPCYFNCDNFKFIVGEEEKLIVDVQGIIKNNISVIQNIDLFTNKSSDLYDAEDLLFELDMKLGEHTIESTQSKKYIIDFANVLIELISIMSYNSLPDYSKPEVRRPFTNIQKETIDRFNILKEHAIKYACIICNLPTSDN